MNHSLIKPHSILLFQGDSITDAGRSRITIGSNSPGGMGFGYPRLVMDQMVEYFPDYFLQFYNRGVSGDRVQDLIRRWESDTMRLIPDLISILIGVNDTWNHLYLGIGTNPEGFQRVYHQLLEQTLIRLPNTKLVLCEPFVLYTGEVNEEWRDDIRRRQAAVRSLSDEFGTVFIPFQSALDKGVDDGIPPHHLLEDGVHPTEKGHRLLADCWLKNALGN